MHSCPTLGHHALQHTRLPYPSSTPRASSNSCSSSWWCHPTITSSVLNLLLLPSVFHSIRVFSNESVLRIIWPKYWRFSSSISPSNEYSGLISFRIDWFDLFAVQGTLKSLLNTTVQKHQFFGAQLSLWSNSHIHIWLLGETIAMIGQTFVSKVMSLLFNILSGFLKLSSKKQENSRKTSTFALLTMSKPFTVWIKTNCGKFFKRKEYQTNLMASWEICMEVKKQQLELGKER